MEKTGGDGWVTLGSRSKRRRERKKKTNHLDQQQIQKPKHHSANTPPPMAVERPKSCFTKEEEEISNILNKALEISARRELEPIEQTPTYRSPLAVKTSDYPKSRLFKGTGVTTPTQSPGKSAKDESDLKKVSCAEDEAKETSSDTASDRENTSETDLSKDKSTEVGEVELNGKVGSSKLHLVSSQNIVDSSKGSYPSSVASTSGSYSVKEKHKENENTRTSEEIKMQWIFDQKEFKLDSSKIDRTRTPEAVDQEKKEGKPAMVCRANAVGVTELNPNAPCFKIKRARTSNYSTHNLATAPYHAPPVPWQPVTQPSFLPIWGRKYRTFPQLHSYNHYPQQRQQFNRGRKNSRDLVSNLLFPYSSHPY